MTQATETIEPRSRRWSYEEYYQMADMGFFTGQRVELIDGEVVEMAPQRDLHAVAIGLAHRVLQAALGNDYWVRVQMPMRLSNSSEPEPDLAVTKGDIRQQLGKGNEFDPLLVVEVADSTLPFDQSRKSSLYASAGITDYWIINLRQRQVEVYRKPIADPNERFGFRYSSVETFSRGKSITPLAAPSAAIAVDDMLP